MRAVKSKRCKSCNQIKSIEKYYKNSVRADGTARYANVCKKCLQLKRDLAPKKPKKPRKKENLKCEVCGSAGNRNKLSGMVLCPKHAIQFKRNGKILNNTRFDKNDYTVSDCGKYAYISLRDKNSNKLAETIVDIEDLDKVLQYRIHRKVSHKNKENELYYAIAKIDGKNVRVHHLVFGDDMVDHINNNGLDNRKANLRRVCSSKNGMNQRVQARSISGVTGVVWNKKNTTWHANIKKDGVTHRLSCSQSTFDDAVKIRVKAEVKYFKQYSNNYNEKTSTIQLEYISHDDNLNTFIEVDMLGDIIAFEKYSPCSA